MSDTSRERLLDLLAEEATMGLDATGKSELEELLKRHPDVSREDFDLAAAELELSAIDDSSALPSELAHRIESTAIQWVTESPAGASGVGVERRDERSKVVAFPWMRSGWLAAAAVLLMAVFLWPRSQETESGIELRERLLRESASLTIPWSVTDDPAAQGSSGDVVWSARTQEGTLLIRGLEANDPTVSQYQLWIFDAERDERFPVDGGVFDVPRGTEEVVVPIRAKLAVSHPVLFAVTVERPGGVVVSDRERIVLTAASS